MESTKDSAEERSRGTDLAPSRIATSSGSIFKCCTAVRTCLYEGSFTVVPVVSDKRAAIRCISVCSRMRLIDVVTSPASSSLRATTPTVWVHSGQVGVSSTTSTPSSRSRAASSGAVSSRTRVTSGSAPITE